MTLQQMAIGALCISGTVACAPVVHELSEDNPSRKDDGKTHSVNLDVLRMNDPDAGYQRAFNTALKTCNLPDDTNADDIRFERALAYFSARIYSFECPEPGKEI